MKMRFVPKKLIPCMDHKSMIEKEALTPECVALTVALQ